MKILTITYGYPPYHKGGYELRCRDVMERLKQKGHDVLIITTRHPSNWQNIKTNEPGIHRVLHHKFKAKRIYEKILFDILDICYLKRKVKDFKPDIIFLWQIATLSNAIIPFFARLNIPVVHDVADDSLQYAFRIQKQGLYFNRKPEDSFVKNFLRKIIYIGVRIVSCNMLQPYWDWPSKMRIYFNCEGIKRDCEEIGIPVSQASVIYAGIDPNVFTYREPKPIELPVRIITPGRIVARKGTKDLLLLGKRLMDNGIPVELTIVGSIGSQSYYDELEQLVKELDLEGYVKFVSMINQTELADLYHHSHICFFPSYQKTGLSAIPLEAMACGCLVITYGNENSKEIIHNRENGFIVPEVGFSEIVKIIQLLHQNTHQYIELVKTARDEIESKFTYERYVRDIEIFLENSLKLYQKGCNDV